MRSPVLRSALLLAALPAAMPARADVAYSNLGLDDAFDADASWTVAGASSAAGRQSVAQRFVSATSGRLTTIEFAGARFAGDGSLTATLFADDAGRIGAPLESFAIDLSSIGSSGSLIALVARRETAFAAGEGYWFGLVAQDDAWLGWNYASPPATGLLATDFDAASPNVGSDSLGALRATTQPVPEPATSMALGLGVVALRRRTSRRNPA